MGRSAIAISEMIMKLTEEQLAAVDHFVESLRACEHRALVKASMATSEASFAAIWDDPQGNVYDAL